MVLSAVALLVLTPFFFIGGPGPANTPLFHALWDCGHIVFFGLLAALLVQKFSLASGRAWLLLLVAVFVLGGAIEIVQAHTGRNGSWQDLLRDLSGVLLGLFLVKQTHAWVRCGRLLAVGLVAFNLYSVVWSGAGLWYAYHQFPQLADFESPLAMQALVPNGVRDKPARRQGQVAAEQASDQIRTQIERSEDYASHGKFGLKIQLSTQRYSGLAFHPMVQNWSGYAYLEMDIYNPGQMPFVMLLRVSDKQHDTGENALTDRFNRYVNIQPGWNPVSISLDEIARAPEHRRMNMEEVTTLVLYANRLRDPRLVYVDNLRLR